MALFQPKPHKLLSPDIWVSSGRDWVTSPLWKKLDRPLTPYMLPHAAAVTHFPSWNNRVLVWLYDIADLDDFQYDNGHLALKAYTNNTGSSKFNRVAAVFTLTRYIQEAFQQQEKWATCHDEANITPSNDMAMSRRWVVQSCECLTFWLSDSDIFDRVRG